MNDPSETALVSRVIGARDDLTSPSYRYDVQGMRAVAVALVILYHFGVPFVDGGFVGVDVFFVISGFVITRALLAELSRSGRIALFPFWARRARRLMPASIITLVLSVAVGALLLPRLYLESLLRDATAVALYIPNILFAQEDLNYLADASPSMLQHYWSLGVEEQFYLVWPILLGVIFLVAPTSRKRLFAVLCVVTAVSLLACVAVTYQVQPWAFFSMPTRIWEFGAGGLVAFYSPALIQRRHVLRAAVGWLAILILLASAFGFDERVAFPGYAAIMPVAAAAVLILVGEPTSRYSPARVLSWRPLLFIGGISYSLYLVHWPVIVLAEQAGGTNRVITGPETVVLIGLTVVIAWLLYLFVERRFMVKRGQPLYAKTTLTVAIASAGALALIATSLMGAVAASEIDSGKSASASDAKDALDFTAFVPTGLQPALRVAASDVPAIYSDGCHLDFLAAAAQPCYFGRSDAPVNVELFGDSHAAQWFPALQALALAGDIHLRVDTKSSCPSMNIQQQLNGIPYQQCDAWRDDVVAQLGASPPDVILLSNYGDYYAATDTDVEVWSNAVQKTVDSLASTSNVIVIADTPHFVFQPPLCLSAHVNDSAACGEQPSRAINARVAAVEIAAAASSDSDFLDLNSHLCTEAECGPIIGSTLVYRDAHHLTATMAATFAPELRAAIRLAASR